MKKMIVILMICGMVVGCSKRDRSYQVTLYSGGEAVRTWEFVGTISMGFGDAWFDYKGKEVQLSGNFVIEEL